MKLDTQPYKGTRDFYPEDLKIFRWMFQKIETVLKLYGYEEYMGPLLESTEIYKAKSGDNIVKDEMYTLLDRGDRELAIRPEMTPSLARMVANKINELPKPIRWYSIPNLYRDEKPQKGRLREHWQLNVDILGVNSVYADLEIIQIIVNIFSNFNAPKGSYSIRYNSLVYLRNALKAGIQKEPELLKSIEKAIDKRAKISKEEFEDNLKNLGLDEKEIHFINNLLVEEIIDVEGTDELRNFQKLIESFGLTEYCVFDPTIVRGFDYYTNIVFEVFDTGKENRRSLFGGGRYNDLVNIFDKGELPSVGYGMGDVTLRNFLETYNLIPGSIAFEKEVLIGILDDSSIDYALKVAVQIRKQGINSSSYLPISKIDKVLKYANIKQIPYLILIGENELKTNTITIKNLTTREQKTLDFNSLQSVDLML